MARVAAGHHAIEKVNTAVHRFQNVKGGTDTHQVTRLILWHMGLYRIDNTVHLLGFLTHGKAADRIAVKIKRGDLFHVIDTQILINTTLIDAKQHLLLVYGIRQCVQAFHFRLAAHQPAVGTLDGLLHIFVGRGVFNALVKRHCDGGSKVRLDLHTLLGAHKNALAVYVRGKIYTLFGDSTQG